MSSCIHTDFRKGQRLVVTMNNGYIFVDKYVENKSGVIILKESGRLKLSSIRAITIYRGQSHLLSERSK